MSDQKNRGGRLIQKTATPGVEFPMNNKTAELKGLLERVTSLSVVETDILEAMVELSRGLKEDG